MTDREETKRLLQSFWKFAREYVRQRGDFKATLDTVGPNCEFLSGLDISRRLYEAGIDPSNFWRFASLLEQHISRGDEYVDFKQLEQEMHVAFLTVLLFTDSEEAPLTDVQNDILAVISESDKRMVTNEILTAMQHDNRLWGESTIKNNLAILVAKKKIDNIRSGGDRGYGLPGRT